MEDETRKLAEARQIIIEALGRATALYGLPITLGRTYALLYLADEPQSVKQVTADLGITKGTASVNLRLLERMRMVRQVWQPGRRGKFYIAERDYRRALMDLARTTMAAELDVVRTSLAHSDRLLREIESNPESALRERARLDREKLATLGDYYEKTYQLVRSLIEAMASGGSPQLERGDE